MVSKSAVRFSIVSNLAERNAFKDGSLLVGKIS
jgi:hypothetical protein